MRGEQQEFRGAVEPANVARGQERVRQGDGQVNFAGDLHALARDIEYGNGPDGHAAVAKTVRVVFPADSERRDNARAGDDGARRRGGELFGGIEHDAVCRLGETLMKTGGASQMRCGFQGCQ